MKTDLLFFKRIFTNRIYWMTVVATLIILLCSVVHKDILSGKTYTFLSLLYDSHAIKILREGGISLYDIFVGVDSGYLWMFCSIIASVPCVLTKRNERFVLFRMSKNRYVIGKLVSNLISAGAILVIAYYIYMSIGMIIIKQNMWDIHLIKKLLSVFIWGMMSSIPALLLVEFVHNKYLILCIPFVFNYFMTMYVATILPYTISKYVVVANYQSVFLSSKWEMIEYLLYLSGNVILCGITKKIIQERRCDCGY